METLKEIAKFGAAFAAVYGLLIWAML